MSLQRAAEATSVKSETLRLALSRNLGKDFWRRNPARNQMTILHKLASSLKRRDEVPNQLLAEEIVRTSNRSAVKELVENVYAEMSVRIVNDRNKEAFNRIVEARGRSLEKESQRKRLARILKKVMA
jgi:hypothetical protein